VDVYGGKVVIQTMIDSDTLTAQRVIDFMLEMDQELEQARLEIEKLRNENVELRKMLELPATESQPHLEMGIREVVLDSKPLPSMTKDSPTKEKIALFRMLFRGRDDVYALRWENERTGKRGYSPVREGGAVGKAAKSKKYLPLTDQAVQYHLSGEKTIGVYPLLLDNTCWFLACDFDKEGWTLDALAYLNVCNRYGLPAYLERSRSGNGGHVWTFFSSPVSATSARQLGMRLLRETMVVRGEMDLASYDRFFPNQDFVPKGGFGNLIALPLQKKCRRLGNTEFVNPHDADLRPWSDQWGFLSQVKRLSSVHVDALLEKIPPISVGLGSTAKVSAELSRKYPAPPKIRCTFASAFSIEKSGVPPWLLSQIKHLASLHNPEFYRRQKLRLETYRTPRFVKCYGEDMSHLHLPRGALDDLQGIFAEANSEMDIIDRRPRFEKLDMHFQGSLRPEQEKALHAALSHDMGVLIAPPGAGKTVMGCFAVATRSVPTLILAHRKPILDQWRTHLMEHLGLKSKEIGQIGGGRKRLSRLVDLAMIQSLERMEDMEDLFSQYGFIVVDECQHIPAYTFERCVKKAAARYILGLTATPHRRDGLQGIIEMQCGPIRYRMPAAKNGMTVHLIERSTKFSYPSADLSAPAIQDIFGALVKDDLRNALIMEDVRQALSQKGHCLILTHRKEHCRILAEGLAGSGANPFVLTGDLGKKERTAIIKAIQNLPVDGEFIIVATAQYLGEGFDCPQVDTLFLAFPISFKSNLVQYVGRSLRTCEGKESVQIYDYVDTEVPVLKRMSAKRVKAYKSLGIGVDDDEVSSREYTLPMPAGR